ncbi:mediator of DNA damage checkpoint protein 1 [Haemorhous mexicanus]|uniref:mediator of DNA damage checkpoint protein 1 n=1 Tax=Haemorhous mexicanus TaxID=30427 RepID=UPI0028BF513F|nr:mediator of DNA damage checkpoint protein 1 [Haemorhous mexicanus]
MAREGALEDPAVPLDVEGPQKRLPCSQNSPDVIGEEPDPDVWDLKMPKVAQDPSEAPDVAAEAPNPDVLWAKNGHRTLLVESDTDVEEEGPNPSVGPQKWLKMTQNVPETPDVGLKTPNPEVLWLKNACGTLLLESDTDVEEEEADPEAEPPKRLKITQNIPETPDVAGKTPNPDVSGPKMQHRMELVDSDTDVDEDPDVQPKKRLKVTQNMPGIPDVEVETASPVVTTPKIGHWRILMDSDTDVEEEEENPDVQPQNRLRMTQNVSETPDVAAKPLNPDISGPKRHSQMLLLDSDTDVEDEVNPDVQPPKRLKVTQNMPRIPNAEVATPNPAVERPKISNQMLVEDSDTDVEEDPDVQPPKRLRRTPNLPKTPDVRWGTPNPDVSGPTIRSQMLLVDSDTDVEEDPDVQPLKRLRVTQNVPETPDVAAKSPNPDVSGPGIRCQAFLVDSDADVEEGEEENPDTETLKKLEMTQNVPESPDVVAQTPIPDVGMTKNGCQALLVDSDTDVEKEVNADVHPSKRWEIPQNVPQTPDVPTQPPNPAVKGSQRGHGALLVDSDTDVEEEENPDVGSLKRLKPAPNVPETPDVRLKMPNPDVSGTKIGSGMLLVDSETDVEEDEVGPDVQPFKRQKITQNVPETPDVLTPTQNLAVGSSESRGGALVVESDPDVEEDEADPDVRPSKKKKITQDVPGTPDVGRLQRTQNVAKTPDVEGEEEGWDPDVATQLFLPPNSDVGEAEVDPDVGSPEQSKMTQKPLEIPDVEEEEASDPNVATQPFLPSPDVGSPKPLKMTLNPPKIPDVEEETPDSDEEEEQESDPDVATQLFLPSPDVVNPESSKTAPKDTRIPDVEEKEESDPDVATQLFLPSPGVGSPEGLRTTPKDPKIPDVEGLPSLDPDVATQLFLPPHPGVEDGLNPDVLSPKQPRMASNDPRIPVVKAETPDSDVEGEEDLDVATQLFLPPDPDVEGEGPSQPGAGSLKPPKSPLNLPKIPDVDMESPNPDEEESLRGHRLLLGDADPDVEEVGPNPDVAVSKRLQTAPKVPEIPDAEVDTVNPDVEGPRGPGLNPDVATQLFLPPDPDVERPESPKPALDEPQVPDVEEVAPNPDVEGPPSPAQEEAEAPPTPQVRRSRRLAGSGGGGGSHGPTPTQNGTDQGSKPRPTPKPRPQRGQDPTVAVLEEATPSTSIKGNALGSMAAPPPEEEEPAEGAKRQLRPRAAPGSTQIRVLFTGLVASPALRVALGTLGGTEATSVHDCSHLVTDGIRRTLKFLCALGRGVPIVTPQWLLESSHSGRPLSPGPFLPRDPPCERRFGFRLRPALAQAREQPLLQCPQAQEWPLLHMALSPDVPMSPKPIPEPAPGMVAPLLQGYQVHVTPSVQPCPEDMRDLVTCCGGTFLPQLPREHAPISALVPWHCSQWQRRMGGIFATVQTPELGHHGNE